MDFGDSRSDEDISKEISHAQVLFQRRVDGMILPASQVIRPLRFQLRSSAGFPEVFQLDTFGLTSILLVTPITPFSFSTADVAALLSYSPSTFPSRVIQPSFTITLIVSARWMLVRDIGSHSR
jgi:hypothetical protein